MPSPHIYHVEGEVEGVHDPSIIAQNGTWYLFGTATEKGPHAQLPMRCSTDLQHWKRCGAVFAAIPDWIHKESPETQDLWAPDISYFNGKYHVYYAFSAFGKNTSGIALVTNKTLDQSSPDFHWVDEGLVLKSLATDDFNAIDPNIVFDSAGTPWLSFGSFWSGIKMRRMDAATGKLSPQDSKLYSLASRERPENPPPAPPWIARGLASHRSSVHRPPRRFLLFVRVLRFVLPRSEEQLPHGGGPLARCHRPLRGRGRQAHAARRRHRSAYRECALVRPGRGIAPAATQRRHHRVPCL